MDAAYADVFKQYRLENGREVTSTALRNVDVRLWYNEGFLVPHEALRRDLFRVEYALSLIKCQVGSAVGQQKWKVKNFFNWYTTLFAPTVHHHHDAEEDIFFPWISSRVEIKPKVSSDHAALLAQMDRIESMELRFNRNRLGKKDDGKDELFPLMVKELRDEWKVLIDLVLPHLAEEEEYAPQIKEKFTEAEQDAQVMKIVQRGGLPGIMAQGVAMPVILAAMDKWAGPEHTKAFSAKIPAPIRFLNEYVFTPAYRANNVAFFESMVSDEPRIVGKSATDDKNCTVM